MIIFLFLDQRLKTSLQNNLSLHQRLNRLEEELNQSRTEISDLHGQVAHERFVFDKLLSNVPNIYL